MMRKTAAWIVLMTVILGTTWAGPQLWPASSSGKTEPGLVLLDRILVLFQKLAAEGAGGRETVLKGLEGIMDEAVQAKAKGQLDPAFFRRFSRLLTIMEMNFLRESKSILKIHVDRQTADFIEDVSGVRPVAGKDGSVGLGDMTMALADEIVNLRIVLESKDRKTKLLDEWMNSFPVGKK
jgi:hypothetical protein